jgi:hypothetical protein
MAGRKRSEIIADLETHVAKFGGVFGEWYVGITADPKKRLFSEHRLRSSGDAWISRRAVDDLQAAEVQEYFKTVRKTQGGSKGTLHDVYVYAYKMKSHTKP